MRMHRYASLVAAFLVAFTTDCGISVMQPERLVAPQASASAVLAENGSASGQTDRCKTLQSIVSVFTTGSEAWLGSGVSVGDGSHVMTAYHVINQTDGFVTVKNIKCLSNGDTRFDKRLDGKIVATSALHDVALIRLDDGRIKPLRRAHGFASLGDAVRLYGTKTHGSDGTIIQTNEADGAVEKGDSGGAVVNDRGELVGIAVMAVYIVSSDDNWSSNFMDTSKFSSYQFVPIQAAVSALLNGH